MQQNIELHQKVYSGLSIWHSYLNECCLLIYLKSKGIIYLETMSSKKKLEQRKEFKEYLSIADKRVLDIKKSGIELVANDEVFVLVNGTNNYWISNHGRLVNNLHSNFYTHKTGYAHFTLSGIDKKIETYTDKLVAEHFLEKPERCNKIWHIDRDKNNCFYKNLVWVNNEEYIDLERGIVLVEELGRQQEYIPYITLKSHTAYSIWNGIYNRCYKSDEAYKGSFMCDLWKYDKDSFAEWWSAEYYECDGESMAIDKDLLFPGNKEYAPDKCCIIPQTLNTMLSNCKKHKLPKWKKATMDLPLGVRYDSKMKMYYGEIKPFGYDEVIRLSYWETPEEAFEEYKRHNQADILRKLYSNIDRLRSIDPKLADAYIQAMKAGNAI